MLINIAGLGLILFIAIIVKQIASVSKSMDRGWFTENQTCLLTKTKLSNRSLLFYAHLKDSSSCCLGAELQYYRKLEFGSNQNFTQFDFLELQEFPCQVNLHCTVFREV